MNDKEYTYDIDKYTIGVDTNGEDGIGLTVAIIKNGEINFLGNCYGENARCIDLLIKENQELKLELSGYRQAILNNKEILGLKEQNDKLKQKYVNAVADYETTRFEKEQLNSLVNSCQEEIRLLKKQLEDKTEDYKRMKDNFDSKVDVLTKIETQQKEFIKYLEYKINKLVKEYGNYVYDNYSEEKGKYDTYIEVLQKYKSIIGGEDENNKQETL